jgi:hypothetical protein
VEPLVPESETGGSARKVAGKFKNKKKLYINSFNM